MNIAHALTHLAQEEQACRRCPLWKPATQAVPGEGAPRARLMLVGEQPGDREDVEGHPFVGPAGRILDKAMTEAGLARADVYLTNAVKHFKHEPRGKRRLHKRPSAHEIDQCRWWLSQEIEIVRPRIAIALGATAYRSLAMKPGKIGLLRGRLIEEAEVPIFVTVHPSFLLRMRDQSNRARAFNALVKDLRTCRSLAAG